jgi:VWFA-related protein
MAVLRAAALGLLSIAGVCAAHGQSAQTQPAPAQAQGQGQEPYTLHTEARIVITDVTVTDRNGNPVHGLGRSAFHIFDNGRPQQLASFEEHDGGGAAKFTTTDAPGVFSNEIVLHPPPVFNVIVLDTTTIGIVDQMYLYQEMTKFVQSLPEGEPLAIYSRGTEHTILLQNFTADHSLLLAAVQKAIPHLRMPGGQYVSELDTLQQIAIYLSQYPGRKNVLWFSGGSNLFLRADPTEFVANWNPQPIYDALDAARIAIYPIDARGLTVGGGMMGGGMIEQHMLMDDMAQATGGHAFYNNNGLAQIASRVIASDANFYTLSYAPHDVRFDNRWHKVKVQLDADGYKLSYRRGYFDDGANVSQPASGQGNRRRLLANGETTHEPELHSEPIVFQVRIVALTGAPASGPTGTATGATATPPKKGEVAYSLHYLVPASAVTAQTVDGHGQAVLGAAVLAMSSSGHGAARVIQKVTLSFDQEMAKTVPNAKLDFNQQINLPKGQDYLYIAVWDMATGRLGTVQVPLIVSKTGSAK